MRPSFDEQREIGRQCEMDVARWLRTARGRYVLPTYDFSGRNDDKAPKLLGPVDDTVLPDLLTWKGGVPSWIEVKRKGSTTKYRKLDVEETGISLRLWEHYQRVQRVTGIPVWILFVHLREGEIRGGTLDELAAVESHRGPMEGRPHIFFRYHDIRRIGPLSMLGAP